MFDILFKALEELKTNPYAKLLWLYRGAWQEWDIHEIDAGHSTKLESAILFHQSQMDRAMYRGEDKRAFWLRAQGAIEIPLCYLMH